MLNNMKKIIIPSLFVFALGMVSCEDNLDIPQKGVVSSVDFYASDEDAEALLANMYSKFCQEVAGTQGIDNPEQVILNYSADDILSAGGDKTDHLDFRVYDEFRYDESNPVLQECYNRYVAALYASNLVISNFSTENRSGAAPKFESNYTKQCVEEARVMRAYLHMQMAILWNRPAIIDRLLEPDELPIQAESQEQILKWVVSECDKAINSGSLPKRNGPSDKNATARMSVGFAQFVAGKAAMFANDPATARQYLGALVNSGDYKLVDSNEYWTNFHVAGDGNSEKIFEPNFIYDPASDFWGNTFRSRWMVADVFCWRTDALASMPSVCPASGWNGGAIQEDFAKKFLAHDGDSPRRRACFLTEDEWLYEMEWNSDKNNASLEEKKADPNRGIGSAQGVFGHGQYFEWKHMAYATAPKILTGGKDYPRDNVPDIMGGASTSKNFMVARYAEALLLYAEACIGADDVKGLAALNEVQKRSGSGKISTSLTFNDVMEEKQYEMWFENCRFPDLVRWSNQGKVNIADIYNKGGKDGQGIHKNVPTVFDEYSIEGKPGYKKEHKLYTTYSAVDYNDFSDKYKYLPFPLTPRLANHFKNVLGWESLNGE
jgi:hypothetical protein